MKKSNLFEKLRQLNPWPVTLTKEVAKAIDSIKRVEEGLLGNIKSQRIILDLFERAIVALSTFPPDDQIFTDPRPYLYDIRVWLVVTQSHRKIIVKAEYHFNEHECIITDFGVRET
jgi:hypothetical protein